MVIDVEKAKTGDHGAPAGRPVVMGTRHMVSSGHYLATHAAFEILEAGGNAVDAGVAAGLTLGVVQSDLVSVAGVAPIMIYAADRNEVVTIDGLGVWPKAASAEHFRQHYGGKIPPGLLRTVVPAAPDAWLTALERYGTLSFGEVARAAIRFAREGFPMHWLMAERIAEARVAYSGWPSSAAIYLPGGRPPAVGELFVQADLGRTLQYMADEEKTAASRGRKEGIRAARDAFYRGDIARAIVAYHRQEGGWLTAEDLEAYRVRLEPPAKVSYGEFEVYGCGPWCQGPVMLEALNLLEGYDLRAMGLNSLDYVHTVVEAFKLAFADRERYFGDPAFVKVPLEGLLSKEYARRRRALIRKAEAWPDMPPAGDPGNGGTAGDPVRGRSRAPGSAEDEGPGTSYVCVVDRHGNAFSATPSDVSTDTPVIPGTGLAVSSRGSQSWVEADHPSVLAPGKRPRLTPNPAMAFRHGRLFMPFGTPGGDVQCQSMLQVFLNVAVFGLSAQQAVEAPRFATFSFPQSFVPHEHFPGRLRVETPLYEEHAEALAGRGHTVLRWPQWVWRAGSVCAIVVDPERKVLHGAADPRREAYAVGW